MRALCCATAGECLKPLVAGSIIPDAVLRRTSLDLKQRIASYEHYELTEHSGVAETATTRQRESSDMKQCTHRDAASAQARCTCAARAARWPALRWPAPPTPRAAPAPSAPSAPASAILGAQVAAPRPPQASRHAAGAWSPGVGAAWSPASAAAPGSAAGPPWASKMDSAAGHLQRPASTSRPQSLRHAQGLLAHAWLQRLWRRHVLRRGHAQEPDGEPAEIRVCAREVVRAVSPTYGMQVGEWENSLEFDNWGNPLPTASASTVAAWKAA